MTGVFLARGCSVFVIPYDQHLAEGGEISLDLMSRRTRQAFMQLAAHIADAFVPRSTHGAAR
jgi:MinD-like ATPase involved in chromosome partitioning or flagellar assembly